MSNTPYYCLCNLQKPEYRQKHCGCDSLSVFIAIFIVCTDVELLVNEGLFLKQHQLTSDFYLFMFWGCLKKKMLASLQKKGTQCKLHLYV